MKRKNILKLISILIVICIIAIVGIIKIRNYIRETVIVDGMRTQKDIDDIQKQVENYVSDKVVPKGLSRLYGNYKGDNDLNDLYRSLYSFVNYLPTLSKKIKFDKNDSIISYYESNSKEIKNNTGITNQNDFISFIEYLNKVGYNGQKFVSCEIDTSTFNEGRKYFNFELSFTFEKLDNNLKLKVHFANYTST